MADEKGGMHCTQILKNSCILSVSPVYFFVERTEVLLVPPCVLTFSAKMFLLQPLLAPFSERETTMRTLPPVLTSVLNNTTRTPRCILTVEDRVLHYGLYQSLSGDDVLNDACLASDASIIRVQIPHGSSGFSASFQVQRISDPTQTAQWSSWSTLPGAAGVIYQNGGCAVTNAAGVLRAFAQRGTGGNNLWTWSSTDNGISWSGPVSVLSPPGGALLGGIASAGNNDVFFLYDVAGGFAVGYSFYSGGSWSALGSWTLPPQPSGVGLAVAWSGAVYTVIYSNAYTLASCLFNPTTALWSAGPTIAPSTSIAITRSAPRLSLADGIYTLTCIEADAGLLTGTVYNYPRLRQSRDLVHWSDGFIVHDLSCLYGAVAFKLPVPSSGSAGPRYYLATPYAVYSARAFEATNATQSLDLSDAVLSYKRSEEVGRPARLEVMLDNAQGVYNTLVNLSSGSNFQPLEMNAALVLSEGYLTSAQPGSNDVVKVGTFHLDTLTFVRGPLEHSLRLECLDLSCNLDRLARYQNSYSNQTVGYLVNEVCARAGLLAVAVPTTAQTSQVVPLFTLQAAQSYRHALDELCAVYGLVYFLDEDEVMQFHELATSDLSIWSYQPEVEAVQFRSVMRRANHIIVSGKPPAGGPGGALTMAELYDEAHLRLTGTEQLLHVVDPKLTTSAQCAQKATFLLSQEQRKQSEHTVTLPLNPALQLCDGITLSDSVAPQGSGQTLTGRIRAISVTYDANAAYAGMHLTLEGM